MEKKDIEDLKERVPCSAVLEDAGFAIDVKESARRAVKYRRASEIVIVIHDGKGWFDPLSEAKGDVFSLVAHLDGAGFVAAAERVGSLVGFVSTGPVFSPRARDCGAVLPSVSGRWRDRPTPCSGSASWNYLRQWRHISGLVVMTAVAQDRLREGPRGSMWAAHVDGEGAVTGWEERGPVWRGFSSGGAKTLFRLGQRQALRICVSEAAIDAMSLAALEELRDDSLYVSTGGGWSPATDAALRALATRPGAVLVAATDNDPQGDVYAARLEAVAAEAACGFERLKPEAQDWNAELGARKGIRANRSAGW